MIGDKKRSGATPPSLMARLLTRVNVAPGPQVVQMNRFVATSPILALHFVGLVTIYLFFVVLSRIFSIILAGLSGLARALSELEVNDVPGLLEILG